jgi:diguanylate cyclase (GGDEF)-like protein
VIFLVIAILTWYLISKQINDKYNEAERLSREINAVADIYEAMILVDLKTDCMTILRNTDKLQKHIGEDLNGYSRRIIDLCGKIASESSRDMLKQFMDPGTYEERIQNSRSISHDFIDCNGRWTRFQIIVVDRNDDGSLRHIIWAIESVDEEYRQQEHLRKLADTDALSGLNNRRSGETGVREMIEKGTSGLFLLIDIDDFKMFNDTFGHDIGDLVIISVADCIRKAFRESDIVFRLGGDEFAAYAVGVNNTVSENIITSRIRNEVDNLELKELGDTKITISIGTAFNPPASEKTFEEIYQEADQKMYDEKRTKHVGR